MQKSFMRIISVILVLAILCNLLPMQILASNISASDNAQLITPETSVTEREAVSVVAEMTEKRTEYSKEFLLSDGTFLAAVYADPVHYEKDGTWQEIDNTLKTTDTTYTNTAGPWEVTLPRQMSKTAPLTVTKDGHTLSLTMSGQLQQQGQLQVAAVGETAAATVDGQLQTFAVSSAQTVTGQVQTVDTAALKEAVEHDALVLEKGASALQYAGVYSDTTLRYDLHGSALKESVILEQYSATLRGFRYTLNTGGLLPVLGEDGSILFLDAQKNVVFYMNAPYLVDDAKVHNYDVQVSLTGSDGSYTLVYLLPTAWLAAADREWPVVLDPAITTQPDVINIRDHTVASNGSHHFERQVLECGYGPENHVQRIFLKYRDLPPLTSSDVILNATVQLYKPENSDSIVTVDVHKVLGTWESETLTWANKPDHNTQIEDYALINLLGYYHWDVTDIVRGWYSGANTGMMFKASDQYEDGSASTWKQFYSSDYSVSAYMPSLQITFRNNNGLESYWDYTSASAGRAGTGYVNSYTGNLVVVREDMGFGGNRMPVNISHVYNLNDSANNAFGIGSGWRTNFNQQVYVWSKVSGYYVWEDSDGTDHYFKEDGAGSYKDEDGLDLTLTVSGTTKTITDKYGNKSYFDSEGRLYKQENNQATKSSIDIAYSSGLQIDYITDGAGRKYDFTYANDLLSSIQYLGTGTKALATTTFTYSGTNLIQIKDTDNKVSTYTYSGNILTSAKDIDGYELCYAYYTPSATYQPYRVHTVSEFDGSTAGGVLTLDYAHNQTTLTDYQGNKQILQFNNLGNTVCVQDDEGHAQYSQYAKNETGDTANKGNQLTLSSKMQNTVGNLKNDTNFEGGATWAILAGTGSRVSTTSQSYFGNRSLAVTNDLTLQAKSFTAAKGTAYTFSTYVKTDGTTVLLQMVGGNKVVVSEEISSENGWSRLEVTLSNDTGADTTISARLIANGTGTTYVDCVQIEKAQTASRYNLIEDGDFNNGIIGWTKVNCDSADGAVTAESIAAPTLEATVGQIFGSPTACKRLMQPIEAKGSAGDTFVVAGWAKGNAAPDSGYDTRDRQFSIQVQFKYTDGTTVTEGVADFNTDTDQWQYASTAVVAKQDYTQMFVYLLYDYNVNSVMFDGIQLFKEEFGNSYTYDADGNVTSVKDLQKQTTTYEYTNNNLTKEILPTGAELTYTYDDYHNVTKATSEEGQVYEFTYDTWGNNTSVSIVNGSSKITSTATYSSDGNRLEKTTDALGKETVYDYDANTNVLKSVKYPEDTDATKTTYTYDSMYRVASAAATTDTGLAMSASYTYENDLLTKIQTPSTTYDFTYGSFGLRTAVKAGDGDQNLATYTYADRTNYLTRLDYGNGDSVQYTYDTKGRVTQRAYGGIEPDPDTGYDMFVAESSVNYKYNNDGNLATVEDAASGTKTTYYYDFTDRMTYYVESGEGYSHSVGYEYDNINNLTSQVETINGVARTTSYTYDADNRVKTAQTGNTKVTYTYDGFGRVTQQVTTNGTTTVLTETYTYNGNSTQVHTYATTAGGVTTTYTYTYDDNGNITSVNDGTYTTTYHYDSANQLVREDDQADRDTRTWAYDNAGNIVIHEHCPYTTGVPASDVTVEYSYAEGAWGDLLESHVSMHGDFVITYDEIGNQLTVAEDNGLYDSPFIIREYIWHNGRQLECILIDGAEWSNTYNTDGLRTERTNGTTTYNYIYNGSRLTGMTVDGHTLYFSYDAAGTPMSVNYDGIEYFYTTNLQGDVTGILNSSGALVVSYTYDAWGNQLSCTGDDAATLGTHNPLRYRGYVYDEETGLYYLQSRYYDPELCRFISADSQVSGVGGDLLGYNMFAYCMNNPVNMSDDSGNWPKWISNVYNWVNNNVVQPVKQLIEDIKSDVKNYDSQNTNVDKVYKANYFSSYKGALVVRHTSDVLTSWASNNTIVLNRNLNKTSPKTKSNLLNHEYGHVLQEQEMGKIKYAAAVFLPSVTFNLISRFEPTVAQNYYNLPWEHDADWRGGVSRPNKHWLADSASSAYFILWGEKR